MRISDWSSDVCSSDLLKGTDDMLPYNAANDTLGGNFLSRINMDLREAKGWSYGASGRFQTLEHAAPYIINAPVQADKTGPAIEALRTDLKSFLTDQGITRTEFDRTVTGTIRERSEEHTSELQSHMRNSYAVLCLKTKKKQNKHQNTLI